MLNRYIFSNELNHIINSTDMEYRRKRFFKNFGCINFRDDEFLHELELAREYHKYHSEFYPEQHDLHEEVPMRCYHVTKCKCGFSEACDSSD